MANYFRNLEKTIQSVEGVEPTPFVKFKQWLSEHLKLMWAIVFMLVFALICFTVAFEMSQTQGDTLLEKSNADLNPSAKIDEQLKVNSDPQ